MQHGSAGVGSATHLGCLVFNAAIGVDITHIPYKGGAPAMTDLIAGRIDYWCPFSTTAMPQIKGDTVKPIALLSLQRLAVLPDLPTAHEQGLANFEASTWNALFLPKGTPPAIVQKLHDAVVQAVGTAAGAAAAQRARHVAGRARPALAGVPRQVHPRRDREMGGADQGQRHQRRLSASAARSDQRGLTCALTAASLALNREASMLRIITAAAALLAAARPCRRAGLSEPPGHRGGALCRRRAGRHRGAHRRRADERTPRPADGDRERRRRRRHDRRGARRQGRARRLHRAALRQRRAGADPAALRAAALQPGRPTSSTPRCSTIRRAC